MYSSCHDAPLIPRSNSAWLILLISFTTLEYEVKHLFHRYIRNGTDFIDAVAGKKAQFPTMSWVVNHVIILKTTTTPMLITCPTPEKISENEFEIALNTLHKTFSQPPKQTPLKDTQNTVTAFKQFCAPLAPFTLDQDYFNKNEDEVATIEYVGITTCNHFGSRAAAAPRWIS